MTNERGNQNLFWLLRKEDKDKDIEKGARQRQRYRKGARQRQRYRERGKTKTKI